MPRGRPKKDGDTDTANETATNRPDAVSQKPKPAPQSELDKFLEAAQQRHPQVMFKLKDDGLNLLIRSGVVEETVSTTAPIKTLQKAADRVAKHARNRSRGARPEARL